MGGGNNKALAAAVAGQVCVIVAWLVKEKFHVDIPQDVSAAVQGLLSFVAVWLIPHSASNGQTN